MPSGGYREGSGRPRGSLNKTTFEQSHRLSELAKTYTEDALMALVDVARNGRTDAARVAAPNSLLDRGYGKPVAIETSEPETFAPTIIEIRAPDLV